MVKRSDGGVASHASNWRRTLALTLYHAWARRSEGQLRYSKRRLSTSFGLEVKRSNCCRHSGGHPERWILFGRLDPWVDCEEADCCEGLGRASETETSEILRLGVADWCREGCHSMRRGDTLGGWLLVVSVGTSCSSLTSWMELMVNAAGAFGMVCRGRDMRGFSGLGRGAPGSWKGKGLRVVAEEEDEVGGTSRKEEEMLSGAGSQGKRRMGRKEKPASERWQPLTGSLNSHARAARTRSSACSSGDPGLLVERG